MHGATQGAKYSLGELKLPRAAWVSLGPNPFFLMCDDDESVSRYARANKNKCKCAGVFDHQEPSTNTTISVVRALGLSIRSVRRGTSRHERHYGGTTNGTLVADTISTCRECNRMDRIKKGERKRERVVDGK